MSTVSATATGRPRQARMGLIVVYFVNGALFGNWASRIPAVKEHVGAGTSELGLSLLGLALGALVSKQIAGQAVARFGSAPVARAGILSSCPALMLPAFADDAVTLGLSLIGFGVALGVVDVGMNAHGVTLEKELGRPVLSSLHASYSAGALLGAVAGGALAGRGLSPLVHFALVAVVTGAAAAVAASWLLSGRLDSVPRTSSKRRWVALPRSGRLPLLLLSFAGLCGMAVEGVTADWGAVHLREDLGQSTSVAALGYAAYSVFMATGRLFGDRATARWGSMRVVMWSVTPAAAIFALTLTTGNAAFTLFGFACLGLGLSVNIPVIFSMAGKLGGDRAGPAITLVSSISGTGFFVGPPAVGFLAEATGLSTALSTVSLLAITSPVLLYVIRRSQQADSAVPSPPVPSS
ncbi:MFS transporter [Streptomyces sp. NPDC102441]|uniref:MFS transporter n=1 Tax=Streptomyces sp. NPDC102441 TaxID=3366176 RepID=UPI00381BFC60